jgi:hypothetical protein
MPINIVNRIYSLINRITKLKFNLKKQWSFKKIVKTSTGFPRDLDMFNQGKKVA